MNTIHEVRSLIGAGQVGNYNIFFGYTEKGQLVFASQQRWSPAPSGGYLTIAEMLENNQYLDTQMVLALYANWDGNHRADLLGAIRHYRRNEETINH